MRIAAAVIALLLLVVVAAFVSERANGRITWHLPTGGRVALSPRDDGWEFSLVGRNGTETKYLPDTKPIVEPELHTDDEGDYWLVSRTSPPVMIDFLTERPHSWVGEQRPPETMIPFERLTPDGGRVLERSSFFGFW